MKRLHRNEETPIVPRTTDVSDSTIRAIGEADAKAAREEEKKRRRARDKRQAAVRQIMGRQEPDAGEKASEQKAPRGAMPTRGVPRSAKMGSAGGGSAAGQGGRPGTQGGRAAARETIPDGFPRLSLHRGSVIADLGTFFRQCRTYAQVKLSAFNIEKEWVFRVLIVAALTVFFAITETTFAARFPLFGETPDLMLGLVIAVAMTEGERFGAVTGLCAGLLIDALGSVGVVSLTPLLYVPVGYAVGILTENYFTGRWPVRALYTLAAGIPRALLTVIVLRGSDTVAAEMAGWQMFFGVVVPGYFSTAVAAVLPHLAAWLTLRAFHKSRAQRIS